MRFLVSLFWNICLTRRGPEEVPAQYALIGLLIIGKIVFVLVIASALTDELRALFLVTQIVSWAAVAGLITALALQLKGHFSRFIPTFGAILGTDLLVTTLYGLAFLAVRLSGIEIAPGIGSSANVLVELWTTFVVGFIMHRALEVNIGLGILAALIIKMFSFTISFQLATLT